MKLLLYLTLFLTSAVAQITEVATDATGQTLLFNTRFRMQTENDVRAEQKIYRWHNGVWTRMRVHIPVPAGIVPGSMGNPFVANGGKVYGWQIYPSHGLFPPVRQRPTVEIFGAALPEGFPSDNIRVSSNGRYVAGWNWASVPNEVLIPRILDTQTGIIGQLPVNSDFLRVASDGSFAYIVAGQIVVQRPGREERRFPVPGIVQELALSDDARWLVLDSSSDDSRADQSIRFLSLIDGSSTTIAGTDFTERGRPTWGLGNSRLVYLSSDRKQVHTWDPATRVSEAVGTFNEPVVDLAVSADGSAAWTVTSTNRLTRLDLQSRTQQEVLSPLGLSQSIVDVFVPGSAVNLPGKFTREQQVWADGGKWPLSDVNDAGYWAQIPWEWNGSASGYLTVRNEGNPFESYLAGIGQREEFRPHFPTMVDNRTATVIAAHSDFRGVVNSADPARGGETVHIYMTGLGALQREVPTGVPGPYDAVPVARSIVCSGRFLDTGVRTEHLPIPAIVYAGGMIGIYQLELTLPANVPDGLFQLICWDGVQERTGNLRTRP